MSDYADEQLDGQLPDCLWRCPMEGADWTQRMIREQCRQCWEETIEPYRSYCELFMVSLDYLEREDVGLHHPELLSPKEELAVLLVRRLLKKEEYLKMREKMSKMEKDVKKLADVRDKKYLEG